MQSNPDSIPPSTSLRRIGSLSRGIYALMGREAIYQMIADFCRELEGSSIREMFGPDMLESSKHSAAFFVQVFGGPRDFNEQFGDPKLRVRHKRFSITEASRQVWFDCFMRILADAPSRYGSPPQHLETFKGFPDHFSRWIVNTADPAQPSVQK